MVRQVLLLLALLSGGGKEGQERMEGVFMGLCSELVETQAYSPASPCELSLPLCSAGHQLSVSSHTGGRVG